MLTSISVNGNKILQIRFIIIFLKMMTLMSEIFGSIH